MNNLEYFKRFVPKKDDTASVNKEVWSYTRVSSKEQFERFNSVESQKEANRIYAAQNNYTITEEFGGTYESAKSDWSRKEFSRLLDRVMNAKKPPRAILIYKMSRFSRSGGSAIGIVNTLVEDLGVNLVEVCTGISTSTERGKAAIYESLFHAFKENLERKEITLPGMCRFLKKGNYLGQCPTGYDHYGPRVRNEKFFAPRQRIELNKDGVLLRDAWKWKASGLYSDTQILAKLAVYGLKIRPQALSKMWRNPFYCAIIVNKMLDEPAKGNWEPIVSERDFIKVQDILEGNISGYQHNNDHDQRPLSHLIKCSQCHTYMVGYVVRKKNLHYYKCRKCLGVSVNAITTLLAKRRGANDLFADFLSLHTPHEGIFSLVKKQLVKIYNHINDSLSGRYEALKTQSDNLEQELKNLKIRQARGIANQEGYELALELLTKEIEAVNKELITCKPKKSNLENLLTRSLERLRKLSAEWTSSGLERKRTIQKVLFPEGLLYDAKNHQYLTSKTNLFVGLTRSISEYYSVNKKGNFQFCLENSLSVAGSGVEPESASWRI